MYPAGVQKGELVFTVPMAPGETVTISHKEGSTSSREYEEIVQDFFESYSERGVAEKTDASMSTESESKHSSALNFGATLSGEYAGVTLTTTLGLSNTSEERESAKQSMQRSREVTEKASARTRKGAQGFGKARSQEGQRGQRLPHNQQPGDQCDSGRLLSDDAKVAHRSVSLWPPANLRLGVPDPWGPSVGAARAARRAR